MIHRTQVAKKKRKLRAQFSPTKENRMHQTKISTNTDKGGFSPAVFRSRLEQKIPVTEYLVCCVCFSFSMAKSMFRMGSVFVSVAVRFHSFALSAVKVPLVQCSRVSVLWSNSLSKPKANFLTKASTISQGTTIFRREVIEQFHYKLLLCPKSAKAKAIVVEPVKQKTSESIVI